MGTLLAIAGIWFHGGYAADAEWRAKAAALQNKIAVSEAQSKDNNVRIKTVYVDRVKVVKETQVVIQERIKEVEKRIDAQCTVDTEVINILNDAAKRKAK
jgi:Flp pilus assembly secretin CpaC